MSRMKPPISFGLPGRLSINGFQDESGASRFSRISGTAVWVSGTLLVCLLAVLLFRPALAAPLRRCPIWVWPVAGVSMALIAAPRSRPACLLLIVAWVGFALYFWTSQAPKGVDGVLGALVRSRNLNRSH